MDGALGGGRVGRAGGSEISGTAARMMLDFARGAGLALDPLVAGLRFDARTVKRLRRVPWDDYCTLVERLEVAAGGPQRLDALIVASFHQAAAPAVQTVIRSLVSPRNLYRFVFKILNPANFPNTDFEYKEQADGWIWLSCQLHDDARPCAAFMRGSLAALRGFPGHLGLPPAEVKVEELTDRSLVALSRLPESRTLMARASVPSLAALRNAAVTLVELFAGDAREWADLSPGLAPPAAGRPAPANFVERLASMAGRLELTPRQSEVLEHVARGRPNKEIAAALGCAENTVEFHVSQLLRKARVTSRTQLIAQLWAA